MIEKLASVLYPPDLKYDNFQSFMEKLRSEDDKIHYIYYDANWPLSNQPDYICWCNSTLDEICQ